MLHIFLYNGQLSLFDTVAGIVITPKPLPELTKMCKTKKGKSPENKLEGMNKKKI